MKNANSKMIGTVVVEVPKCTLEEDSTESYTRVVYDVWSDGTAYGDSQGDPAVYRNSDGKWRVRLTYPSIGMPEHPAHDQLEKVFRDYLHGIICGPVDPLRHLK